MQKLFAIFVLLASLKSEAQTRYIIKLKNKQFNPYSTANPSAFLSTRSIERRIKYNIPLDSTDLPVTPRYIDSIRSVANVNILNVSKWLNQVAIQTSDPAALTRINNFTFVQNVTAIGARSTTGRVRKFNESFSSLPDSTTAVADANYYNYGRSYGQVRLHQAQFLHNHGFRGKNIQMAILDAGFFRYLSLPTFDSIRMNNQILGTWDFVQNEASVDEDNSHGMQCLSAIAANLPGRFVGTAPESKFYLFRTEDVFSEYPIEEQNWAVGIERADSVGVDITSTSLGYYQFDNAQYDYTYNTLDGKTTIAAKAASLASKKGIMMVIAAGNEGNSSWRYIISPADADSIIAVAAVDTTGNVAGFSSYGPRVDGAIKPELAATGWNAVVANPSSGNPQFGNGTSFACPNLAGVTSCLMQAYPECSNLRIMSTLKAAASKTQTPDNRVGFGIPDVKKAFVILQKATFSYQLRNDSSVNSISFTIKCDSTMTVTVERKLPGQNNYSAIFTNEPVGNFRLQNFIYTDDLSNEKFGNINYRFVMTIGTDTTYLLDSGTVIFSKKAFVVSQKKSFTSQLLNNTCVNTISFQLKADSTMLVKVERKLPNASQYNEVFSAIPTGLYRQQSFTFTDDISNAPAGNIWYRYSIVIGSDTTYYIDSTSFINNAICNSAPQMITIFPNPVIDQLTIKLANATSTPYEFSLLDAAGKVVYKTAGIHSSGTHNYTIPMKQFMRGLYIIKVYLNKQLSASKKILRQ